MVLTSDVAVASLQEGWLLCTCTWQIVDGLQGLDWAGLCQQQIFKFYKTITVLATHHSLFSFPTYSSFSYSVLSNKQITKKSAKHFGHTGFANSTKQKELLLNFFFKVPLFFQLSLSPPKKYLCLKHELEANAPSSGWVRVRCCQMWERQRPNEWLIQLLHSGDGTGRCSVQALCRTQISHFTDMPAVVEGRLIFLFSTCFRTVLF